MVEGPIYIYTYYIYVLYIVVFALLLCFYTRPKHIIKKALLSTAKRSDGRRSFRGQPNIGGRWAPGALCKQNERSKIQCDLAVCHKPAKLTEAFVFEQYICIQFILSALPNKGRAKNPGVLAARLSSTLRCVKSQMFAAKMDLG